eukprot:14102.XXX_116263_116845_1 [CDS] Oithona nana genome sequencing.
MRAKDTLAFIVLLLCITKNCSHGLTHPRLFKPLPETTVDGFCKWEVRLNTVYNRIPPVITEIQCVNQHSSCAGNTNFKCRTINSKLTVAYTDVVDPLKIEALRNTTFAVGCSCVMKHSTRLEQ